MREALKEINGTRKRFSGTFDRLGSKPGWKGKRLLTALLLDIRDDSGTQVCDHLWLNMGKTLARLGSQLYQGTRVSFSARVKPYVKGYVNHSDGIDERRLDYRLSHPTNFAVEPDQWVPQTNRGQARLF